MSKICLCLTGKTIKDNLQLIERYRKYIDIAELRVDFLTTEEKFYIRRFPELAGLPVILTVRRKSDGGLYDRGESSRIILLSNALAFAKQDKRCNFAYVDLEDDLEIPSLEEVARAFGTRIIRSYHNLTGTDEDLLSRFNSLYHVGDEIAKVAVTANNLDDVKKVFDTSYQLKGKEKIIIAMGDAGLCTRVLSEKLGSAITYTSAKNDKEFPIAASGQVDPIELCGFYRFRSIDKETAVYGISGYPLTVTSSPEFFNSVFKRTKRNAVYLRFPSASIKSFIEAARKINIQGASVTIPHKESLLEYLYDYSDSVEKIGACNTIFNKEGKFLGFNTDAIGFSDSLLNFINKKTLKGYRVTVIGAGGASRAVVSELARLNARVLIINRNIIKAAELAKKYNFKSAGIDIDGIKRIKKFSDIIINTTSVGMETFGTPANRSDDKNESNSKNDPINQYKFSGREIVMDIIYKPPMTPLLKRASFSGCRVLNGFDMLERQAMAQYKIFFGEEYPPPTHTPRLKAKTDI
ncbi:MAG: type I 3-dehydroquinate dehydratase [Termitinemataceae bacterium]|nr:MAG: type I 3-dehydroquinate dehydratase [Termitinemataceae bacterium]